MIDITWLDIARELQALAQTGLEYTRDPYDRERFERVRELVVVMMAQGSGEAPARILELFKQDVGYCTPKIDVRGAAFKDERILLVRESTDGRWSLPGGWADVNQSAAESVTREIFEESGFETRAVKLAAVLDRAKQGHRPPHPSSVYKMFFLCEITGGAARPSTETTEVGFFALDALPELSVGRVTQRQVERMFDHWRQPGLPTDFD